MIIRPLLAATYTILLTASLLSGQTPDLDGTWEGALTRGGSVQLLRLRITGEGQAARAEIDIPDLFMYREPVDSMDVDGDRLSFVTLYGRFDLLHHPDILEMTGTNEWSDPLKLHLKKVYRPADVRLQSVEFHSRGVTLSGTLILPATPGPHPAAVVVHGAGPRDRSRWTYRSRGDVLARLGVAALVFDQRGRGASGGGEEVSFDDLAGDVAAAVRFLGRQPEVDPDRIGLQGASQGGWISLMAARKAPVSFLVIQGMPARSVWDAELDWVDGHMAADGFSAVAVDSALAQTRAMFRMVETGEGVEDFVRRSAPLRESPWADYVYVPDGIDEALELVRDWRRERYDPIPDLRALEVPAIFFYGELDLTAPPDVSVPVLDAILEGVGASADLTVRILEDVPHNLERRAFYEEGSGAWPDSFYVFPRKAPRYEPLLAAWLASHGVTPRPSRE